MRTVYIYVLREPTTRDVRYVGLTRYPSKRLSNECHRAHNMHLRNWVEKLRRENLKPIMEIVEVSNELRSCEAESIWIAWYRGIGADLMNYTSGGEKGYALSEETREKLRIITRKKRRPMSAEHKAKISASNKGRKPRPNAGKHFSKLNVERRGIPLKEETKQKLRAIGKANVTPEFLKKMSEAGKLGVRKSKFTDEQKAQIKLLITNGYSHKVISEAYGLAIGTISEIKRNGMWKNIASAISIANPPPYKTIPLVRLDSGQYRRA